MEALVAEYVRGVAGAHDVLHDALLERGLAPLPRGTEPTDRLEAALERLSLADQLRAAAASVRRLAGEISDARSRGRVSEALAAIDAAPDAVAPAAVRRDLFQAWTGAAETPGARIVFAAWMLARQLPTAALRTTRAVRPGELDLQISAVAAAFRLA